MKNISKGFFFLVLVCCLVKEADACKKNWPGKSKGVVKKHCACHRIPKNPAFMETFIGATAQEFAKDKLTNLLLKIMFIIKDSSKSEEQKNNAIITSLCDVYLDLTPERMEFTLNGDRTLNNLFAAMMKEFDFILNNFLHQPNQVFENLRQDTRIREIEHFFLHEIPNQQRTLLFGKQEDQRAFDLSGLRNALPDESDEMNDI